ncbi:pathogenesis-related protein PR-1-like [Cannabis sativa]|uniref:pathogenesis-related protein PR-1-like n=1 Tax=Cannabis sativa TaxID=3483 RepID=UPI0029CA9F4E|nr:pathogenesis-related protein PR-1-like [Cannabis sativa]
MVKPHLLSLSLLFIILCTIKYSQQTFDNNNFLMSFPQPNQILDYLNNTTYAVSAYGASHKQLCFHCLSASSRFLAAHNIARAKKGEPPLFWDAKLARHARRWASQRKADCALKHSFQDGEFTLGENIFWGGGSDWTPANAVEAWMEEEKDYSYESNSCANGKMCGHYTQIVWQSTKRVGCARVICDNKDTFMICNYDPPGNYIGEKPY